MNQKVGLPTQHLEAVIFDMDGVVTQTAKVHAAAWKELFDAYLKMRAERSKEPFSPFDVQADYLTYVDGKPRYEGVRSFLESRGIHLDYGTKSDKPGQETVCGLGNKKDGFFERRLHEQGVEVFESTMTLIRALKSGGIKVAIVSSSKHCQEILKIAGIESLFDARVDGKVSEVLGLKGKPNPDIFTKSAELLGADPRRSVVVEDAIAGVQGGRNGGFGLVIGVDRANQREALKENGADIVVSDLREVSLQDMDKWLRDRSTRLPSAMQHLQEIGGQSAGKQIAVFLDYDGTLSPIVERPELAVISSEMRDTVRRLASCCTTAIVSGRSLADVSKLVQIEELFFAGNHGFEIAGPHHTTIKHEKGREFLAAIQDLYHRLANPVKSMDGAFVEDKRFSLSVHYRLLAADRVPEVEAMIDQELKDFPTLYKRHGKKVFEIRPKIDWHKGKAVLWLLKALNLDHPNVLPIYIGDDVTDEDAFKALEGRGLGVLVSDTVRPSAARYTLRDTPEVQQFLEALIGFAQGKRR